MTNDSEVRVRGESRNRIGALGSSGLLAAVLILVLPLTGAFAQSSEEIERDLREVEQESERYEQELDAVQRQLNAAIDELADIGLRLEAARGELVAAEGQVALAEMALEEAEDERDLAKEEHEDAVTLLDRTEAQLAAAERKLTTQLVESFKYGSAGAQRGAMVLEVLRRAEDPNSFSVGMKQLRTVIDDQDATVTEVFRLRDERSQLADEAALARRDATQAAIDAERTLEMLEQLRAEAERIAAEIEADEARQRQVTQGLQQSEAELASTLQQVSQRESELRADFRAAREREAAERAARLAAEREAQRAASRATGGGRAGNFPGAEGGPFIDGMVCPVQGAVAGRDFSNDWGYPRSGGRWHQGNDVFANRGTPVVAVHDGVVVSWNPPSSPTRLGGITVTYETADGSHWYNAHLDTIADGVSPGSSVSRGQVIGTVGNTGNARTTPPHLHIGRRYGGSPVNPWPTISQVCR
jgi:septal ring factor EnvC (AmiA/AmiB activator)